MSAVRTSYGLGRYADSEVDVVLGTTEGWTGQKPPLIFCHPAGSLAETVWMDPYQTQLLYDLAQDFIVMVADLGGIYTFGNETAISRLDSAMSYLQTRFGVPVGRKAVLLGISMGGGVALNYARVRPQNVAGIAGLIPAVDYDDAYLKPALVAALDTAFPPAYTAEIGKTYSPLQFAKSLPVDLPIRLWWSENDTFILPSTIAAFKAARPQTVTTSIGARGHSATAAYWAADGVKEFCRQFAA